MNATNDICDLLDRVKLLEDDHDPEGWPAVQMKDITVMRKEIEDMQGLLLWALWHHQGGGSPVGQPIRKFMGIGQHDALLVGQVHHANDVVSRVMADEA